MSRLLQLLSNSRAPGFQTTQQFSLYDTTDPIANEYHTAASTLELQRFAFIIALICLVVYISLINFVAIVTLIYGIVAPSAALSVRMVCVRKKPVRLQFTGASPTEDVAVATDHHRPTHQHEVSPAKSTLSTSTVTSGRRTAVIAGSGLNQPEEDVQFDSSAFPYLLSLAISDFIIGFLIAPLQLDIFINNRWRFSSDLCDFWLALDIFFSTSSTLHTAAIAVDRWWTITRLQASTTSQQPQTA